MHRELVAYLWGCIGHAWRGSVNNAFNWASVIGIGVVGAYREHMGSPMSDPHTWQGIVGWTIVYTAVAWVVIFLARLIFVAPFRLYYEQKTRADKLEGLRQVANDASRPPSFDIGFEYSPFDEEAATGEIFINRRFLRIWVENIEARAISDCRVVIESFDPKSPIRIGTRLLPDNRGANEESSALFDLAATEKRFLKFIDISGAGPRPSLFGENGRPAEYWLNVRCDQESSRYGDGAKIDLGKYFMTIVVHGKDANSRRLDLTIEVIRATELHVAESETTASYRKELAHEHEGSP
jgi:hypothetical protein